MMVEHDCGEIPVVESKDNPKPVGVITDRDVTCRVVAAGKNPRQARVRDAMTSPPVTVKPETSIEDCCRLLERSKFGACRLSITAGDAVALFRRLTSQRLHLRKGQARC